MMRAIVLSTALFFGGAAVAGCPEYLNHDLRKLHSQELINLCEMSPGQPILIVNTASHCGYTKQFKGLQELNDQYRDQGRRVVGFASVCYVNYGVTFTMFAPTHVRGEDANPVFRELALQTEAPSWNFNKYVVDSTGKVVMHFDSSTSPDSPALKKAIESVL